MNLSKVIFEGWTVQNFIDELSSPLKMIMDNLSWQKPLKNKEELKKWCMENQPYHKKHIPEVVKYFANMYSLS